MGPEPRRPASVRNTRTSSRAFGTLALAGIAVAIAIWLGLSAAMAPFTLAARPAPTPTPTPTPAPCVAEPQLRDVAISQGLPYAKLVRGKETLVRLYLSKKQCVPDTTVMQFTGGSLTVQGVATPTPPIPTPVTPPATIPPYSAPITADSTGYPYFVVPGNLLVSSTDAAFTATFRATINFTATANGVTTPGSITFTTKPDGSPFTASVDQKTKALRVLVVPMGNTAQAYDTQFTPSGLAAVQQAMQTLSRIYPVPDGVSTLGNTAGTGGIRYVVDPGMVNIGDLLDSSGQWCGKGGSTGNFTTLTPRLAAFLNNWNTANTTANDADIVLGVVDDAISKGSLEGGCAEGIAQFIGSVAWIRAIPENTSTSPATPSKSGALAALEIGHALGLVPTKRDDAYSLYHSPNVKADPNGLNRSFNTSLHSRILDDRAVMTLSGVWNNDTTLLERPDYAFLNCKLGGTMSTECGTAGTSGEITGVAAAPRFVISGTTDGTACGDPCAATEGTHILESYFSTEVLRTTPGTGNFHLLQKAANGTVLRDDIVRTYSDESVHEHAEDDIAIEPTDVMLINAAVEFNTAAQIIELRNIVPGGANTLLYSRTRDGAPVFSTTDPPMVTGGSDEPFNFTDDPDRDDIDPAVSADGRWLAWSAASFGDFGPVVLIAPTDDLSAQVPLEVDDDVIESSQPAWCSTSDKLAFVGESTEDEGDIMVVDVDFSGTSPTFLNERTIFHTDDIDYEPDALHPTWSPNCLQLAFEWGGDIYRIDADGEGLQALTNTGRAHWPTWSLSPGDDRIAYMQTATDGIVLLSYAGPRDDRPRVLAAHGGEHFVVTTVADENEVGQACLGEAGCSLREAISNANATPNFDANTPDIVEFAIGTGPQIILPTTALPAVTSPVIIDATTQPGFDGSPVIELNGSETTDIQPSGLTINGGGSTVRGLIINNFDLHGIQLLNAGGNLIEGNYIGTDPTGMVAAPNVANAIYINGSPNNTVGGTTAEAQNLISGNTDGIQIRNPGSTNNTILGNLIGTDATGTSALAGTDGQSRGVTIYFASRNTIGGTIAGAGNVIAAGHLGIYIEGIDGFPAEDNVVQGNFIGTNETGTLDLGNSNSGVLIFNSANNTIGGTAAGARNVLAYNGGFGGVNLQSNPDLDVETTGNAILGNSIHSNEQPDVTTLGIDLGFDGVTANDDGDPDTGPNSLQNFPVLTSATATGVDGTLNSAPDSTYRIELFSNASCDASGNGEGETFLDAVNATTDADGNASFSFTPSGLEAGDVLTATATDPAGNTSEFSACGTVDGTGTEEPSWTVDTTDDVVDAFGCGTLHCSLREAINRANEELNGEEIDVITFDISDETDAAPHVIGVDTPLPTITEAVVIDASTEPDFTTATDAPVVQLDGTGVGGPDVADPAVYGLVLAGGDSTIRGLSITNFRDAGVRIVSDFNTLEGNYIGVEPDGITAAPNGWGPLSGYGVMTIDSDSNAIGLADGVETLETNRNIISGNDGPGVIVSGSTASNNSIENNYIGTNATGTSGVPNGVTGVVVTLAAGTSVGGTTLGTGNVISGNAGDGVTIFGHSDAAATTVQRNLIGTGASGTDALPNDGLLATDGRGVLIVGSSDNTVIGNVIAGNGGHGVSIEQDVGTTEDNVIVGNASGVTGVEEAVALLGNAGHGVSIEGASGTQVGGDAAGDGNVIGGNAGSGIRLESATFTKIEGNAIGTGVTGVSDLGNGGAGVSVGPNVPGAFIGGDVEGRENYIAFNDGDGVEVDEVASGVAILRNRMHSNGGLAIDLKDPGDPASGVTPNDVDEVGTGDHDTDTGANQLQNFPVLETAIDNGATTTISGRLETEPSVLIVEFFSSADCDPSGFGEGQTYLGSITVETNARGEANFAFDSSVPVEGELVTATATHLGQVSRGSSESSACVEVTGPPGFSEIRTVESDATAPSAGIRVTDDGSEPSWGPDGKIAFVRDDGLYTIDHAGADGTEVFVANTIGGDISPTRGGGGVMGFVRYTGGDADVWLIRGGATVSAGITDAVPANVRASVLYRCPAPLNNITSVLFVGLEADEIEGNTAQFQVNFDPSLSCKDGQFIITANDGVDRVVSAPLTPIDVDFPEQDPVASRHAPLQDQEFLESDGVAFEGIGWDADDGVIIGKWYTAPASHPETRTLVGSGELIDHKPFDVGCYIVTLVVTDAGGNSDEDSAEICVIADSDSDGFSDAEEQTTYPCFGAGAASDPRTPYQDADLDGIPNGEDPAPCTRATSYRAILDFDPDTLNYPSTGKFVTVAITVPYRNVADIKTAPSSSLRLTEIAGDEIPANDSRFWSKGFEIRNGVLNVKFDRQALLNYVRNERGIINQYVSIEVSGESSTSPKWTFSGTDGFLIIPAN